METKEYKREWVAKRRSEFFSDKVCNNCGSEHKLELHHVDPTTKIAHAIWSWRESRRLEEIDKCIVLCQTCHRAYHAELRRAKEHGATMYRNGCRCEVCRLAQNARMSEYRLRRKG